MKTLTWTTVHNQAEGTMTHEFDNGVACTYNFEGSVFTIEKRGKTVDTIELVYLDEEGKRKPIELSPYANILCMVAKASVRPFWKRNRKLKQIRYHV